MTGYAPTRQGTGRPVQLLVMVRKPGRAVGRRCRRRREEEQVDLLLVVASDEAGEGLVARLSTV